MSNERHPVSHNRSEITAGINEPQAVESVHEGGLRGGGEGPRAAPQELSTSSLVGPRGLLTCRIQAIYSTTVKFLALRQIKLS